MSLIQAASGEHCHDIARIIRVTGLDVNVQADYVAQVLEQADHATYICLDDSRTAVGFVDGFLTAAKCGNPRGEVDLIGVVPELSGRGIGRDLLSAFLRGSKAEQFRSLVRIGNKPAERLFRRAGFSPGARSKLFSVQSTAYDGGRLNDRLRGIIPVQTLTYSGCWIEEEPHTLEGLEAVRRALRPGEIGGWVVAETEYKQAALAAHAGFALQGDYRYWTLTVGAAITP